MTDRARPMLAPVLVALTGVDPHRVGDADGFDDLELTATRARWAWGGYLNDMPWVERDPLAALELLEVRDLAPPRDDRRGFVCGRCGGRGTVDSGGERPEREACPACAVEDPRTTGGYRLTGTLDHLATLPDAVSWTSLGREQILTAEALAGTCADALGVRLQRIVWRVGVREPDPLSQRGSFELVSPGYSRGLVWARAAEDIYARGVAVDRISTAGTVTLVVPPVGGG